MTNKKKKKKSEEKVYPIEQGGRYDGEPGFCSQVPECGCGCNPGRSVYRTDYEVWQSLPPRYRW